MAFRLPNGSTISVAGSYGTAVVISGISNANPAVATSTAHGLSKGDIILVNSGWSRINNRVFRVGEVTTDTFELEGVDTTSTQRYPTGGGTGSAKEVLTWTQVPQVMSVDFTGGDQQFYSFQFLEDDDERQLPTVKSAASLTLNVADDPDQAYVSLIEGYDEARSTNVMRLNLVNGDIILYPAVITITSTPTLTVNELMQRTISLAIQGKPSRYKAAA